MTQWLGIIGLALLLGGTAFGQEVRVTLSPVQQTVRVSEAPRFTVKVEAISGPLRVLNLIDRQDLKDNYARVTITRDGKEVEGLLSAISDPGPTDDSDYISLKSGESISFAHDGSPLALDHLAPGVYVVTVNLSYDWGAKAVPSNAVIFRVEQP